MPEIVNGTRPGAERAKTILIMEILQSLVVDLVVADIRMPGMDGLELGARISKLPAPPPVVYASASDQPPANEQHHYLQKPFTGPDLIRTIAHILS